ncbi:MAG: hypothetical protein ABUK17_07750, partial [Syntrophobacteria bacterium]
MTSTRKIEPQRHGEHRGNNIFCPIGRRRSGKRSHPCGHDLLTRWFDGNGWSQAEELAPEAEALF